LNIVYYTSGTTGFGRVIIGISIGNALIRNKAECNYTIVSNSSKPGLAQGFNHINLPVEDEFDLSKENYQNSIIYNTLHRLKPDVLIVNHIWFNLYNFIHELNCKTIYLSDLVDDRFFSISLKDETIKFIDVGFDRVIAIEPFKSSIEMELINPLLLRNRDEIFSREVALERLGKDGKKKLALYGMDGHPYDTDELRNKYLYLEDVGYEIIYPKKYGDTIYPISDYYNGLDFLIYGAGYTQFWEAVYFNKEAVFNPYKLRFSDQSYRVQECQEYYFDENGADQLVDIIMNM